MSFDNIAEGSLAAGPQRLNVLHQLIDIVDKLRKLLCGLNREPPWFAFPPRVGARHQRTAEHQVENAEFGKGQARSLAAADQRHPSPNLARAEQADAEAEGHVRLDTQITGRPRAEANTEAGGSRRLRRGGWRNLTMPG